MSVGALAYAVIEGPKSGWGSPSILALFATAAVALLTVVPLVGWRWFPRGDAALQEAEREEARLATTEK